MGGLLIQTTTVSKHELELPPPSTEMGFLCLCVALEAVLEPAL